jgi:alanine racemase
VTSHAPRPAAPTVARIDLGALAHNYATLAQRAGGRDVIAVVKADAYGHGAPEVARRLSGAGCRSFAVAVPSEAAQLRRAGVDAELLLLGGVNGLAEARAALALRTVPVLHGDAQLAWVAEAARALDVRSAVHVEVDTGMRRLGVPAADAVSFLERVAASGPLALEGVSTHFARADEPDPAPTRMQLDVFRRVLSAARGRGVRLGRVHVANSAGLLAARTWGEEVLEGDAVRPGLALYGVPPAPHLADADLRPVMTLETRVAAVRPIAGGEGVGYGHDWHAPRSGWVATLPIGYADGVPWAGARRGAVSIGGVRRPLAGRVSMDCLTVWLGDEPVAIGQEAIVFGTQPGTDVGTWAEAAGTIPYELLVRVGARVARWVVP